MLQDTLKTIGLTDEEVEIYLSLINSGTQSAMQLSKNTKVKRTYVYKIVSALKDKGLATESRQGRTTLFSPNSPDHLLTLAQAKKQEAEMAERSLEQFINELKNKYQSNEVRPTVEIFEGESGIRKVFNDIYGPKNEPVYGAVDLEESDKAVPNYIIDKLIPLRVKNGVKAISFLANSPTAKKVHANDENSLRQSVLVDKKKFPLPAEIDVYEDKIAMMSFDKGQYVSLLIQNQSLATTLKSIFKLAFENKLKEEER